MPCLMDRRLIHIFSGRAYIVNNCSCPHQVIVCEADEFGGVLTSPYFLTIMDVFPVRVVGCKWLSDCSLR